MKELKELLENMNEYFKKMRISEINTKEFIEDLEDYIKETKITAEENEEKIDEKRMYKKIRIYLNSKYIFQDGKHDEEIKEISLKMAKEVID